MPESETRRNDLSASTRSENDCTQRKHRLKILCQCISLTSAMLHHASACKLNTARHSSVLAGISNKGVNRQLQTFINIYYKCSLLVLEFSLIAYNFSLFYNLSALTSFLYSGSVLYHSGCRSASIQVSPSSHPSQQGADPSSSLAKAAIHSKGTEQGSHH